MATRFIFGVGTGRCGTVSLSRLLNAQPGLTVTHEAVGGPIWRYDDRYINTLMEKMHRSTTPVAGDIAYHLMPYLETLWDRYAGTKVICLRRDKKATITSFRTKLKGRGRPWQIGIWNGPGKGWRDRAITPAIAGFEKTISTYYDQYYACAEYYQLARPLHFRIWPMEALNSAEGQREILRFAGVGKEDMQLDVGLRHNQSPQQCLT